MFDDEGIDPHVRAVEDLLSSVEPESPWPLPDGGCGGCAAWFCACGDDDWASTWLVLSRGPHGIGWCRVPAGVDPEQRLGPRAVTGEHTFASGVLAWLRGEDAGFVDADPAIVMELLRRIDRVRT